MSQELAKWIQENQTRITKCVLDAMRRVDGVSDALTDPGIADAEARRQKIDGLVTAGRAVLAEYVGEEFDKEFWQSSPELRSALKRNAELAVRESQKVFVDLLVQKYGQK